MPLASPSTCGCCTSRQIHVLVDWNRSKSIKVVNYKKSYDRLLSKSDICRVTSTEFDRQQSIFIDYRNYRHVTSCTKTTVYRILYCKRQTPCNHCSSFTEVNSGDFVTYSLDWHKKTYYRLSHLDKSAATTITSNHTQSAITVITSEKLTPGRSVGVFSGHGFIQKYAV